MTIPQFRIMMISNMRDYVNFLLTKLITHRFLQKLWTALFKISLRGMGMLNAGSDKVTGEAWLIDKLSRAKLGVVIDVGANTAVFGIHQLKASKIYAFEPHPRIFKKYLSTTSKQNIFGTTIHVINSAVAARDGRIRLYDFAESAELKETQPTSTLASANRAVIEKLHGQEAQGFLVPSITLDSFARKEGLKEISFLKIDVEGLELEVLRGAKRLLKNNSIELIQFEFNQMHVFQKVYFRDFLNVLHAYELYRLSANGLLPLSTYSPVTHEQFSFQNILAIHKDHPQWVQKLQ